MLPLYRILHMQASSNFTVFDRFADEFLSGRNSLLKTFDPAAVDAVLNYSVPAGDNDNERIYLRVSDESIAKCNLTSFRTKDNTLCTKQVRIPLKVLKVLLTRLTVLSIRQSM